MSRLTEVIEKYKELSKEKDCLARTFRGFRDYGNPKSTITSGAEESQRLSEEYGQVAEWLKELQALKDKQEQGLLIELPCPVGTVIYIVNRYWHSVEIGNICGISECDDVDCFCYKVYVDPDSYENILISDFGKEWFLTEAEAEEALARMKGENKAWES